LRDYLISSDIIRAFWIVQEPRPQWYPEEAESVSSTRPTRVFKGTLSLFHVLKKRRGKKKNRKRADINEVTSVTYRLLVTFPSLQPRGR
jgi:hypothetical protein